MWQGFLTLALVVFCSAWLGPILHLFMQFGLILFYLFNPAPSYSRAAIDWGQMLLDVPVGTLGLCLWRLSRDRKLIITEETIRFPQWGRFGLKNQRTQNWQDLESCFVNNDAQLFLGFKNGSVALSKTCVDRRDGWTLRDALLDHCAEIMSPEDMKTLKLQLDSWSSSIESRTAPPKTAEDALATDKQLMVHYSPLMQRLGLLYVLLLFPVWGVVGTLGTLGAIIAIPFLLGHGMAPWALATLMCPVLLAGGIIATTSFFDTTMTFSEHGISFPLFMAPFIGFRRERLWSDVKRLRFRHGRNQPFEKGKIDFVLPAGLHVTLALRLLSASDLEKLLLALSVWGQRIEQDPELRSLQAAVANRQSPNDAPTYTQMWEEEMNRRFSATGFVPLKPGSTLRDGQLRVVKQLAFGGLSAVYQAQWQQTELVVLKEFVVPDADEGLKAKAQELFEREALILMKLSHPRLARVRDCFTEQGRTYLLLDYIPGTDLRQIVMQKGKLPEETVLDWAKQIAEIVKYLHAQVPPVIHRDLTPDNILVTADNQIMLIDFGAANEFVGTATGTLVGKQSFIAPEQFRGDTVPQSDIYSFGATVFYLLTGEEPQALSQSSTRQKHPQVSEFFEKLVADCTAFDTNDRLPSAEALCSRLAQPMLAQSGTPKKTRVEV
jgi:serine/threonine-protein kinase